MVSCSRNARLQQDREGSARCPSCSQNVHGETVLVRCVRSYSHTFDGLAQISMRRVFDDSIHMQEGIRDKFRYSSV